MNTHNYVEQNARQHVGYVKHACTHAQGVVAGINLLDFRSIVEHRAAELTARA